MLALEPGQSFAMDTEEEYIRARGTVHKLKPRKFSVRKVPFEGWRIWRLE